MNNSGLHGESFCHAERQASRRDALAEETFVANIFFVDKERLKKTDQAAELHDVVFGDGSPAGYESIAGLKTFESDAFIHVATKPPSPLSSPSKGGRGRNLGNHLIDVQIFRVHYGLLVRLSLCFPFSTSP